LDFTNRLEDLGLVPSYGSVGDALDNAAMETFWATLKRELVWTTGITRFETRAQLRTALFDYIEIFYNRERHQAAPRPPQSCRIRRSFGGLVSTNACPRKRVNSSWHR
jgi:transposase InsO family protein